MTAAPDRFFVVRRCGRPAVVDPCAQHLLVHPVVRDRDREQLAGASPEPDQHAVEPMTGPEQVGEQVPQPGRRRLPPVPAPPGQAAAVGARRPGAAVGAGAGEPGDRGGLVVVQRRPDVDAPDVVGVVHGHHPCPVPAALSPRFADLWTTDDPRVRAGPRAWQAHPMTERNVLGGELETCGTDPMTGFYRDGNCTCGPDDIGLHAVCAVMTAGVPRAPAVGRQRPVDAAAGVALRRTATPATAGAWSPARWLQSYEAGVVAPVVLAATHERALEVVPIELLTEASVDVPAGPQQPGLTRPCTTTGRRGWLSRSSSPWRSAAAGRRTRSRAGCAGSPRGGRSWWTRPSVRRAEAVVGRYGAPAVTLCFLTIGVQTAVNAAAGSLRMPLPATCRRWRWAPRCGRRST